MALPRIRKELQDLKGFREDEPGFSINAKPIVSDKLFHWKGIIIGPINTPYTNGKYTVDIVFPIDYPFYAPSVTFTTKIYHPNITEKGKIDLPILNDQWSPALTITKVLLSICAILDEPIHIDTYLKRGQEYMEENELVDMESIISYENNRYSYQQKANQIAIQYANATKQHHPKDIFIAIQSHLVTGFGEKYIASMLEPIVIEYVGFDVIKLNKYCKELKLDQDKRYEYLLNKTCDKDDMFYPKQPSIVVNCVWFRGDQFAERNKFKVWNDYKIRDIRQEVGVERGRPTNQLVLLFNGKILHDDDSIHKYNITNGCIIHELLKYD